MNNIHTTNTYCIFCKNKAYMTKNLCIICYEDILEGLKLMFNEFDININGKSILNDTVQMNKDLNINSNLNVSGNSIFYGDITGNNLNVSKDIYTT